MHDIEPHFNWRDQYIASEDEHSPFFQKVYDEFRFTHKIYNYYIHPQWDDIGSSTLFIKVLFVDYQQGSAVIELIGEWNDCLHNDIMVLKTKLIDSLIDHHIYRFVLICENVLNFHGSDDCYYAEWMEEIIDEGGWIAIINSLDHVEEEFRQTQLHHYLYLGKSFNFINWRTQRPKNLIRYIESLLSTSTRELST
jgi:hypothetical protein